ncbi:MAG: hypothetical protein WBA22_01615 [Candidatus Methanofastidiosia archaeon]
MRDDSPPIDTVSIESTHPSRVPSFTCPELPPSRLASYPLVWRMLGFLPCLIRVAASMYYLEELARTSM